MKLKKLKNIREEMNSTMVVIGSDDVIAILRKNGITADNRAIGSFLARINEINDDDRMCWHDWEKNFKFKAENQSATELPQHGNVYKVDLEYLPALFWNVVKHFRPKELENAVNNKTSS